MDEGATADVFLFEAFRLDQRAGALFRRDDKGAAVPVAIGSRGLAVLAILMARHGDLVSKNEIMQAVWPGTVVEDNNLTVQISALRRVLDQGRAGGSCIQTIPGRGYRFAAPVTRVDADAHSTIQKTSHDGKRSRPRLSIVVLPFANLSDDREQQYFADGITEDLTTDLSRIANLLVISRNTAFTYKSKPVDTKDIGRELGVRYVLEGSVQRSGSRVRVNGQLIDAETDAHLWAERFDRDASDLLALQDEITRRIALALKIEITAAEAARPAQNPDALDYVLRGRAALDKPASPENYAAATSSFEHALEIDPQSVDAQLGLAQVLASNVIDFSRPSTADADAMNIKQADTLANRALAAAPRSPYAHYVKALILRVQQRCADAIREYEMVLALDRNEVRALANEGRCKILVGPIGEAIPLLERAIRLSPRDPNIAFWYWRIGEAHLLQSHIDEAIVWLDKARGANEALPYVHAYLAAAYALKGEGERAAAELAEARKLVGEGGWQKLSHVRATRRYATPAIRALSEATLIEGLRKAGIPEE